MCCVTQENLNLETVKQQFDIVKHETNTSHVSQWGDKVCIVLLVIQNNSWLQVSMSRFVCLFIV